MAKAKQQKAVAWAVEYDYAYPTGKLERNIFVGDMKADVESARRIRLNNGIFRNVGPVRALVFR